MSLGSALAFEVWGRGSGDWSLGFSVLGFRFGLRALANLGLETAENKISSWTLFVLLPEVPAPRLTKQTSTMDRQPRKPTPRSS